MLGLTKVKNRGNQVSLIVVAADGEVVKIGISGLRPVAAGSIELAPFRRLVSPPYGDKIICEQEGRLFPGKLTSCGIRHGH